MGIPRPALVSLALLLGCSSSSAGALKAGSDGGHLDATTGHDGGGGGSSGGSSSGGTGGDGGGGSTADCGVPPSLAELLADSGAIFCTETSGGAMECPPYQECCLGGVVNGSPSPNSCTPFGTPCDGDAASEAPAVIQCNGLVDCAAQGMPGSTSCCLKGAQTVSGCAFPMLSGGTSIECEPQEALDAAPPESDASAGAAPCAAGETQVCNRASDCPTGKTCTAATWNGRPLGVCQ